MSEQRPTASDGASSGTRGKRPPRGGNNSQGGRGTGIKRNPNQSGNRDSDSQASDVSAKRRSNSSRGGRGGGAAGRKPSRPGSAAAPSPKVTGQPPVPAASDSDSPALSNLQKVISDMRSIPASNSSQNQGQSPPQNQTQPQANAPSMQNQSQTQATAPAPSYAQTTQSNLTPTAAPFQPSFVPGEVPPRHRKAQSMGPAPPGPSYTIGQYAPYLDSMSEDAENPTNEGTLPPMTQFTNRQPMGSFQAPRFSSMSQSGSGEQEMSGSSGRPQLAPSFTFGAKRRTNSLSVGPGPAIGEEDAGFQFPQQNQPQQQQQHQNESNQPGSQGANRHGRTGSEINGILSQQIALQSQIDALQQQQQALLQQQLASNQVCVSVDDSFLSLRSNPGYELIYLYA